MSRVLRWEVPIDGQDHGIVVSGVLTGTLAAVIADYAPDSYMEFWTLDEDEPPWEGMFRVFPTGEEIPSVYNLVGTADRVQGLVWHLFKKAVIPVVGE